MKKILVPLDFSEHAVTVYRFALKMAKKMQASIVLYHASHLPHTERERIVELEKTLDNMVHTSRQKLVQLCAEHTPPEYADVPVAKEVAVAVPAKGILDAAAGMSVNMILMGMRNRSRWDDLLFGSVARDVLKKVDRPMLVIPPEHEPGNLDHLVYFVHYGYSDLNNFRLVSTLAAACGATMYCLFAASEEAAQIGMERHREKLRDMCVSDHHATFNIISPKEDVRERLLTYIKDHSISLLAMERDDRTLQKLLHVRRDTGIVRHLDLPVLFV